MQAYDLILQLNYSPLLLTFRLDGYPTNINRYEIGLDGLGDGHLPRPLNQPHILPLQLLNPPGHLLDIEFGFVQPSVEIAVASFEGFQLFLVIQDEFIDVGVEDLHGAVLPGLFIGLDGLE